MDSSHILQKNRIEHQYYTIVEMTRVRLTHTTLYLLDVVVNIVFYILNQSLTSIVEKLSLLDTQSHIKMIVCICFVHVHGRCRTKLDAMRKKIYIFTKYIINHIIILERICLYYILSTWMNICIPWVDTQGIKRKI